LQHRDWFLHFLQKLLLIRAEIGIKPYKIITKRRLFGLKADPKSKIEAAQPII